jgi:hypothetical protein
VAAGLSGANSIVEDSENRNDLCSKVEVFDMFTTSVVFSFSQAWVFLSAL